MYGFRGILFEFLTQPQNMAVDGACARIVFVTPDLIQQLVARNDQPRVLNQVSQGLEFHVGQLDRLAFAVGRHFRKVDPDVAEGRLALRVQRARLIQVSLEQL